MEVLVNKTKLDEPSTSRSGRRQMPPVLSQRKQPQYDADMENMFTSQLEKLHPNLGFSHINKAISIKHHLEDAARRAGKEKRRDTNVLHRYKQDHMGLHRKHQLLTCDNWVPAEQDT